MRTLQVYVVAKNDPDPPFFSCPAIYRPPILGKRGNTWTEEEGKFHAVKLLGRHQNPLAHGGQTSPCSDGWVTINGQDGHSSLGEDRGRGQGLLGNRCHEDTANCMDTPHVTGPLQGSEEEGVVGDMRASRGQGFCSRILYIVSKHEIHSKIRHAYGLMHANLQPRRHPTLTVCTHI